MGRGSGGGDMLQIDWRPESETVWREPRAKAFPPCTILWGKKLPLNPYSFVLLRFFSPDVSSFHPFHVLFSPLLNASPFSLPHSSRRSVVQINKHKRFAGERGRGIETPCNSHGGEVRNKTKGWVSHGRIWHPSATGRTSWFNTLPQQTNQIYSNLSREISFAALPSSCEHSAAVQWTTLCAAVGAFN